jgi:hypothetical protein
MNIDSYSSNKRGLLRELTASGACRLRRDLSFLKKIKKAQESDEIILTKSLRAALFPWNIAKVKLILKCGVQSLEAGMPLILGKTISLDLFNDLFSKSSVYERISEMDYEKAAGYVVRKRNEKC